MSQILIQKQELKPSQILRTYAKQFTQIRKRYSDERNGRCAIGAMLSYYGWDGISSSFDHYHQVRQQFTGNNMIKFYIVQSMNDDGCTFDQIADWLEESNH